MVINLKRKPGELLEIKPVLRDKIPVIKRFTGGGTVIVDHGTVFVSFICNKDAVPDLQPYPRPIMAWTSLLYDEVFLGVGDFKLRENGMKLELLIIKLHEAICYLPLLTTRSTTATICYHFILKYYISLLFFRLLKSKHAQI